jgi:hypothetical protein
MQDAADFVFNQGLIKKQVVMKDYVNLSFLPETAK